MPDQRTAGVDERSAPATVTGLPSWGAVLLAATMTLIGLAVEAGMGHRELGGVFAGAYALGCVAAVLAVRRSGIFTAVIQPPLLLFVAVPLAYYLFHESAFGGLKDILITCGYPLIERFPLMLFASAAVLLIGLVRWYLAMSAPPDRRATTSRTSPRSPGLLAALATKLASAFAGNGSVDERPGARPARPRHLVDRPGGARRARPRERGEGRSRRPRPPREFAEFTEAPPRRRRAPREDDRAPEPRGRSRQPREPRRTPPPQRRERPAADYRGQHPPRGSRFEPGDLGRDRQPRPQYPPYPPYEPRRRPAPGGMGPGPDRHPVSRVRYRDQGPSDYDGPPRGRSRH